MYKVSEGTCTCITFSPFLLHVHLPYTHTNSTACPWGKPSSVTLKEHERLHCSTLHMPLSLTLLICHPIFSCLALLLFFTTWATADLLPPSSCSCEGMALSRAISEDERKTKSGHQDTDWWVLYMCTHTMCVQSQAFGGEGNKARLVSGLLEGGTKINTLFITACLGPSQT